MQVSDFLRIFTGAYPNQILRPLQISATCDNNYGVMIPICVDIPGDG
jgi:hypothetical protein